eukprot:341531_1
MAASLTYSCLLSIVSYMHVHAYTKSTVTPIGRDGDLSGTGDGDGSYAWCSGLRPTLIGCAQGYEHSDARIYGSYTSNGEIGECAAQNGENSTIGVIANTLCMNNDYKCHYHTGSTADSTSTIGCADTEDIMVSCSPHTTSNSIHGAYVGTQYTSTTINSSTLCTAHSEEGSDVAAEGICCQYNGNDGYQLDCKTIWSKEVTSGAGKAYAKCDLNSGYNLWGCSGYSRFKDTLAFYKANPHNTPQCVVEPRLGPVQAVATCCRLYKEQTDSPTPDPLTSSPTANPSKDPSAHPSTDPTVEPSQSTTDNSSNVPTSRVSTAPTHEEYDVITADTASFESTADGHGSGTNRSTIAFDWSSFLYIAIGVCMGCIVYVFVVYVKRPLRTDTNPRAPSLGKTHPPSIGTVSVPGAQKSIDSGCKDNEGSDSSHGLYDACDPYHTPTVGEMATPGSVEGEKSIVFDSVVVDIALIKKDEGGSDSASSNIESLFDPEDPYQ